MSYAVNRTMVISGFLLEHWDREDGGTSYLMVDPRNGVIGKSLFHILREELNMGIETDITVHDHGELPTFEGVDMNASPVDAVMTKLAGDTVSDKLEFRSNSYGKRNTSYGSYANDDDSDRRMYFGDRLLAAFLKPYQGKWISLVFNQGFVR